MLLAISATSETIDSLEMILSEVKTAVDGGKNFEEAAKAKGLEVKLSNWFKRGGDVSELGHISGLSSFAFFNPLRPREESKTSEVLQNSKWVALFEKSASLAAGTRSDEFAKPKIEQSIKSGTMANTVVSHLKASLPQIAAIAELDSASRTSVEKVTIDSATVSFESYLPGLGYATPELYRALATAKEGERSGTYTSGQNAVMLKVIKKSVPDEAALNSAIRDELSMSWQYGSFSAFGDYMRNLDASAKVVNNLDLYYRE
jgi:peptidyl-prolyl cis-trans isomerase D